MWDEWHFPTQWSYVLRPASQTVRTCSVRKGLRMFFKHTLYVSNKTTVHYTTPSPSSHYKLEGDIKEQADVKGSPGAAAEAVVVASSSSQLFVFL